MPFVAFVPGLKGPQSDFTQEAFTTGLIRGAIGSEAEVVQLEYQSPDNLLPKFSEMGVMIADQIRELQKKHGHNGVVVGSSVGGKAVINALPWLEEKPDVVLIAPVIDTTSKIVQLASMHKASAMIGKVVLDESAAAFFPVPVSYNKEIEQDPGVVKATRRHLADPKDFRLLRNGSPEYGDMDDAAHDVLAFGAIDKYHWRIAIAEKGKIPSLAILAGQNDPYCLPHEIAMFKDIAHTVTTTVHYHTLWTGGHNEMGDREKDIIAAVQTALGTPVPSAPAAQLQAKTGPQNG